MLILDVYNLLHLPTAADLDVPRLCALIGQSRYAGQRCIAVCDGMPGVELRKTHADIRKQVAHQDHAEKHTCIQVKWRGVEVCFVGSGRSADDRIEQLLEQHRGRGRDISVVSSDRRLRRAAKRAGALSIVSSTFLDRLLADSERALRAHFPAFSRDIPLDPYSVTHWLKVFGMNPTSMPKGQRSEPKHIPPTPQSSEASLSRRLDIKQSPPPPSNPPSANHQPAPAANSNPVDLSHLADDPVLREALAHWQGRLTLDELDMKRWLDQHNPPHHR